MGSKVDMMDRKHKHKGESKQQLPQGNDFRFAAIIAKASAFNLGPKKDDLVTVWQYSTLPEALRTLFNAGIQSAPVMKTPPGSAQPKFSGRFLDIASGVDYCLKLCEDDEAWDSQKKHEWRRTFVKDLMDDLPQVPTLDRRASVFTALEMLAQTPRLAITVQPRYHFNNGYITGLATRSGAIAWMYDNKRKLSDAILGAPVHQLKPTSSVATIKSVSEVRLLSRMLRAQSYYYALAFYRFIISLVFFLSL